MTDYYALLGIGSDAQEDVIQEAIRHARRKWTPRQNSHDSESRSEAERAIRDIAEAERILLDPGKRSEYDHELKKDQQKSSDESWPDLAALVKDPNGADWIDQASELMNRGAWSEMVSFMAPVVKQHPDEASVLFAFGIALAKDGKIEDAITILQRCVEIAPFFDDALNILGDLFYDKRRFAEAEKWYTRSTACDEIHRIDLADAQNRQEKYSEALANASIAWEANKGDTKVEEIYIRCLRDHTYQSLSVDKLNGIYEITNKAQLNYLKSKLPLFDALQSSNSQKVRQVIDAVHDQVAVAESKKISYGAIAGYAVAVIVLFVIGGGIINVGMIPFAAYKIYQMMQPHYKKSHSTVDRRTGLQK